jgi:hypothetical protein
MDGHFGRQTTQVGALAMLLSCVGMHSLLDLSEPNFIPHAPISVLRWNPGSCTYEASILPLSQDFPSKVG